MSDLAQGGPVEPGMPYIVGTGGPELFIPADAGTVIPNHIAFAFDADLSGDPATWAWTEIPDQEESE